MDRSKVDFAAVIEQEVGAKLTHEPAVKTRFKFQLRREYQQAARRRIDVRIEIEPSLRGPDVQDGPEADVIYSRRFCLRVRKRSALPLLALLIEAVDEQRRIQSSASVVQIICDYELIGVIDLGAAGDLFFCVLQFGIGERETLRR